jgi:hypothetical protein
MAGEEFRKFIVDAGSREGKENLRNILARPLHGNELALIIDVGWENGEGGEK